MFVAEAAAGLLAGSAALLADSLDMLGDALVYGVSLVVIGRSQRARAGAATLKGTVMLLFSFGVLAEVAYKLYTQHVPDASIMSVTAAIALGGQQHLPGTIDPPPLRRHQHEVGMDLLAKRLGREHRRNPGCRGRVSYEHRLAGYHRGPIDHRPLSHVRIPSVATGYQ